MSEHKNSFTGPVCQHVRLSGQRCTQPALRDSAFCRFHDAALKTTADEYDLRGQLPVLEDEASVQIAIMRLLRYLMRRHIDRKDVSTILYGLQLASTNLARERERSRRAPQLHISTPGPALPETITCTDEVPVADCER